LPTIHLKNQIVLKKTCAQEEAATGQMSFASLFQTGCARECYSNCNSKATELVNNGSNVSNINGKFTAIKDSSQPERPSVAKIICSVVAQLWAFNLVSATWCGAVVRCHKCVSQMMVWYLRIFSHKTVHQSIVEGGIFCDLKMAEWMFSSSSLFIGIDESTKQRGHLLRLRLVGNNRSRLAHLVCPTNHEGSGVLFHIKDA